MGLGYVCLVQWACGFTYVGGLATAACVLLSVAGAFGFFGVSVPLFCGMCSPRGCGSSCALTFSILTFILALAGTICGGIAFSQSFYTYQLWLQNFQTPGYALAVVSTCMWALAIVITSAMTCCSPGAPKAAPVYAADPTAFSGANPSAPMNYA